jgi:hypothetical protein
VSIKRTLLALGVLAAIMLVGCKQPVGLPGKVHAAGVALCTVDNDESWSGYVSWWYRGNYYQRQNPDIKWGFAGLLPSQPNPRDNGFCMFNVPYVDDDTATAPMACTLYYRQMDRSGAGTSFVKLVVTRLHDSPLNESDEELFSDAWGGDSIAWDSSHANNDVWYSVPLTQSACQTISAIAQSGGGYFYTGWITRSTTNGDFAKAYGAGDYSPYIKMTYP